LLYIPLLKFEGAKIHAEFEMHLINA
jgi:hypothetical protein